MISWNELFPSQKELVGNLMEMRNAGWHTTRDEDGKSRAELVSPMLNAIVGKECNWSEKQCGDFFEALLRKYCPAKRLDLLLAVSGYGKEYCTLGRASERRNHYIELNINGQSYDADDEDKVRKSEVRALKLVAKKVQSDYLTGELAKFVANMFHEELPELGLQFLLDKHALLESFNYTVSLQVRFDGYKTWNDELQNVRIGDVVQFQFKFVNNRGTISSDLMRIGDKLGLRMISDNVMIRFILPNNLEYIPGSTILYNSNHQKGLEVDQDTVATSGINIGSYVVTGDAYVRMSCRVVNKSLSIGRNHLVTWANATVAGKVEKDSCSLFLTY